MPNVTPPGPWVKGEASVLETRFTDAVYYPPTFNQCTVGAMPGYYAGMSMPLSSSQ